MATTEPMGTTSTSHVSKDPEAAVARLKDPPPPVAAPGNKAETLEDLYALFPQIGDGQFYLKLTRVAPKSFRGHSIAGWIDDIHEPLTMSSLSSLYGGGLYTVAVMGPTSKPNAEGKFPTRQLLSIEVQIKGEPNVSTTEESMNRAPMSMGEPEKVQMTRLQIERDREKEQQKALERASSAPEHVVRSMREQASETVQAIRTSADEKVELLREQARTYSLALMERDKEMRVMREDLLRARSESAEGIRRAEQELERRLREAHEVALRAQAETHAKELANRAEATAKELSTIRDQHYKDMHDAETRHQSALTDASRRYVEDMARRDSEANTIRANLKESFDSRLLDMKASLEREIASVRADRDREVASLRATYDNSEKFTKETASIRMVTMTDELTRIRAEVESLRAENMRLQKASVKDPIAFLQETKMVATDLLGMVSAEEAAEGRVVEEKPFDFKQEALKTAFQFAKNLPDAAKNVAEQVVNMRQQNQQNQAAAQQMQQQGMPGPRQMGPGPGGGRRRMAPPPQVWGGDGTPPPYVGPVHNAEIPFVQPYVSLHAPVQQPAPQQQPQAPSILPDAPTPSYAPPPPQATMSSAPPQVQQQQQQPPQQQQTQAPPTEGIELFIAELGKAIEMEMPPSMFAQGFVSSVTAPQAAQLLKDIPVDAFLNELDRIGRDTPITATLAGRDYAKNVWAEVAKIVAGG
jgi:hypothetical protein